MTNKTRSCKLFRMVPVKNQGERKGFLYQRVSHKYRSTSAINLFRNISKICMPSNKIGYNLNEDIVRKNKR